MGWAANLLSLCRNTANILRQFMWKGVSSYFGAEHTGTSQAGAELGNKVI